MTKYLALLKKEIKNFEKFSLTKFARDNNDRADALARYASASGAIDTRNVILMSLGIPSITNDTPEILAITFEPGWRNDIAKYLSEGIMPDDRDEARRVQQRSLRYFAISFLHPGS